MKLTRRQFMAGTAATAGAAVFVACGLPERELVIQSPADLPEDLVRGEDAWYATVWPDSPGGDGLIVRVMQGRAKKTAGNPDYPVNLGKQSARYDATLQMLYHPDRIKRPLMRRSKGGALGEVTWAQAERRLLDSIAESEGSLVVVTNPLRGHLGWVASQFAGSFKGRHVMFDPVEQGVLHAAIKRVFGQDRLPDIDIANSNVVLSFGADWLSTWVSPVGMSVKYGKFRLNAKDHGYLTHVESRMSMTAAAADRWLPVRPGWEGRVALAIGRIIVDEQKVPADAIAAYRAAVPPAALAGASVAAVAGDGNSGIPESRLREAAEKFTRGGPGVAFGGGSAGAHSNGTQSLSAIFALNYLSGAVGKKGGIIFNPPSSLPGVPDSAHGASFGAWQAELAQWRAGSVRTVILRGADVVHGLPRSVDAPGALAKVPNVIAFATVLDDSAAHADLVLPEKTFLETWGTDIPEPAPGYEVVGFQQPVASPAFNLDGTALLSDARGFGDVLLWAAGGAIGATSMQDLAQQAAGQLFDAKRGAGSVSAPNRTLFWNGVLQRGGFWDTKATNAAPPPAAQPAVDVSAPVLADAPGGDGEEFTLVPFVSNSLLDGRLAATPWAQASPDPVSSAAWSTWAEVSKSDARRMGIVEGDRLLIRSATGEIEALAYPHPGAPPGVIGVPMGQGHEHTGRWAAGRGSNVLAVLTETKDADTGALAWAATRVRVLRKGVKQKLAKFEGDVEAYPTEPGVPVLVVSPGQTAHEAQEAAHEEVKHEMTERALR